MPLSSLASRSERISRVITVEGHGHCSEERMKKILFATFIATVCSSVSYAADYQIDPSHSSVVFKVKHLAISSVPGRFGDVSGTFKFDPANIEASSAEAKISVASINTMDAKRDDHLKSAEFLDIAKFPALTFKSTKIEKVSDTEFKATGDLTLHGVTKPVTLDVEYGGAAKDPWGKERAAFEARTKINRKDFGLAWSKTLETGGLVVGDDVQISLEIEGVKG
jgi:polyisoprenoid-binding protein YceI